jgi:uncharacterized protein (TIGR00251 family)
MIGAVMTAEIRVRVTTRASREQLAGLRDDGVLLARISAPPVDGRANQALCKLIARAAGVAPSKVSIVRGEHSRDKLVRVEGVERAALRDALISR